MEWIKVSWAHKKIQNYLKRMHYAANYSLNLSPMQIWPSDHLSALMKAADLHMRWVSVFSD